MARTVKTAQEYIQSSFSPVIALLCSPRVDNVVAKNNLSLTELFQPFSTMDWEGQFREPSGSVCIVKKIKLVIRDVNWKPLPPTEARKQLNNAVLHNYSDKTVTLDIEGRKLEVPQTTLWFDAWRETYLEVQFPSDHEYTKHFLSCIIVGTTLDENIIELFTGLNQQYIQLQNVTPPKLPKWFNSAVLKTYLLLHDVSSMSKEKADLIFETVKQSFGTNNCFMLSINSKSNLDPGLHTDYWVEYVRLSSRTSSQMTSSISSVETPLENQTFPISNAPSPGDNETMATSPQDNLHPLATTDNDVYDNANSLQTHSFSGSSESVNVSGKALDCTGETHGAALSARDVDAIKGFLKDFASKALLPYIEKQISQLTEAVANRKGVSRSLLSATKRWFGTNKTGTTGNNAVIYSSECPELQLRRLGDLWFMCGQWQRAFDTYHTAKREFYADSAWLCYAGALEMAAISAFMAGDDNKKTQGYMEESIVTYLNTCRMGQYAVRATLLSALCLTSSGLHGEAAKQLIRMTSEDSDLRSAMLLEQAALSFLSGPGTKPMCRKYAFHMVLAGHRFSKAGQKKHAYRCYKQAYQVFENSGWRLSTDHVQFALGRLAGALKLPAEAVRWLAAPLSPSAMPTHQAAHQQLLHANEYMQHHQQWIESCNDYAERLPVLPLPLLEREATAVLCVGPVPLASPGKEPATSLSLRDAANPLADAKCWHRLEEMLIQEAEGSLPMIFKPTVDLFTHCTDGYPVVPQEEPIQISVTLRNHLKIKLIMRDVELLWQFNHAQDSSFEPKVVNNEPAIAAGVAVDNSIIVGQKIKTVVMEGESKKILTFSLTTMHVGEVSIKGLVYKLINGEGTNENGSGPAILGKLELGSGVNHKRLTIKVIPHAPCLQMMFSESSNQMKVGEIKIIDVEFKNVGPVDMKDLFVAVSEPSCMSLITSDEEFDDFISLYDEKFRPPLLYSDERAARTGRRREQCSRHVRRLGVNVSGGGGTVKARLALRAPGGESAPALLLLALCRPRRLLRHRVRLITQEAVEMSVAPRRSIKTVGNHIIENLNLAVEMKNVSDGKSDMSIQVLDATLLSRQWKLTTLRSAEIVAGPLSAREKLHLVMKAERISETIPNKKIEWSTLKIDSTRSESILGINTLPYSKFVTEVKPRLLEIDNSEDDEEKSGLIQSMLVVRWVASSKNKNPITGQLCLWLSDFIKTLSSEKDPSTGEISLQLDEIDRKPDLSEAIKCKRDSLVVFKMEHEPSVDHNFKERSLCLIPVTINIVNCYGVPVKVFIDMSKKQNRESFNELNWAGALSYDGSVDKIGVSVALEKFESRRVTVRAICATPGTYIVGDGFTVTASSVTNGITMPTTHQANNTSLLVVKQAA